MNFEELPVELTDMGELIDADAFSKNVNWKKLAQPCVCTRLAAGSCGTMSRFDHYVVDGFVIQVCEKCGYVRMFMADRVCDAPMTKERRGKLVTCLVRGELHLQTPQPAKVLPVGDELEIARIKMSSLEAQLMAWYSQGVNNPVPRTDLQLMPEISCGLVISDQLIDASAKYEALLRNRRD